MVRVEVAFDGTHLSLTECLAGAVWPSNILAIKADDAAGAVLLMPSCLYR